MPWNTQSMLICLYAGAVFVLTAIATKTSRVKQVQRIAGAGASAGGVLHVLANTAKEPTGAILGAALLFTSLMVLAGTVIPAFRRRTELLDDMRKRVEAAGGQVVRTQRLVMPIKGIDERKAAFYALFATYPQRRGVWYVCEPSHGRPYWIWKDSQGQTTLPVKMPHASVNNSILVVGGAWVILIVAAVLAAAILFVLWVAKASR